MAIFLNIKNKMKIIVIADIHGRSIWKEIISKENDFDSVIFLGDYFDTHGGGYSANRQIENFKDIIAYKKANMDKVTLLIGNHDVHYCRGWVKIILVIRLPMLLIFQKYFMQLWMKIF